MNNIKSEQQYFPFGQDVERLRVYVRDQLIGEETKKNQNILRQFQKQAEARKHHYLNKHRFSTDINNLPMEPKRYKTLEIGNNNSQNYISDPKKRYPLIPADRKKPPIYRYYDSSLNANPENLSKSQYYQYGVSSLVRSRFNNEDKNCLAHRNWALRKIKESASLKRSKRNKKPDMFLCELSDSDKLILELQKEEESSKMVYEDLSHKLKKLKKYRVYIKQHQKGRWDFE